MSKELRTVPPLGELLQKGRDNLRIEHAEMDQKKIGNLRAGNSGILTEQGEFAGCCPHAAHLRQLGVETETHSDDKLIMFQMGILSETAVFTDLKAALPPGQTILQEEETPIRWETSNGTPVTGRPDGLVLKDGVPFYGIELKTAASFFTTKEVLLEGEPKLSALIQAAHYSWKLGVPYKLSYKNYVNQTIPGFKWVQSVIQNAPDFAKEHINFKGDYAIAVKPYEITYELDADEFGYIWFRIEGQKVWTKSIIREQDIERFYEFVANIKDSKQLGRRVNTVGVTGKKKSYSHCDMYCPVHTKLSHLESNYDEWLEAVKDLSKKGLL